MDDNDKKEKQDYVISRLTEAMSASAVGEDVFQRLAELDAADESQIRKAELLFGNRGSYLKEIDKIIANSHLTMTCNGCEDAVEHVAGEIVEFVDNAREILERRNPFRKEREALVRSQNYTDEEFGESWVWLNKSLRATYQPDELNVEFYDKELSATFVGSTAYSLVRFELLRDWERQLLVKDIDFELNMLSALRSRFTNVFREKLADFRTMMNNPFFDTAQIGLFWGLGQGVWRPNTFNIMTKYAALIHKNKSIQRLLSELGREGFRDAAELINAEKETKETRFSRSQKSDIAGVMESDDLSALLPIEVAMLSEAKLESDFYKRFTEKKLRTFSYQSQITKYVDAVEKKIRLQEEKCGPFIVCIDTSGSMSGTPEELAKTICYGLIIKSQEQKRNCFVITFSTRVEVLDISDLKNNSKTIVDFLMHSFNGGTDLSPALRKAATMLEDERYRKADVLFISDFIAGDFEDSVVDAIVTAKSRKTRFHALRIGQFSNDDILKHFNIEWIYKEGVIALERDSTCN